MRISDLSAAFDKLEELRQARAFVDYCEAIKGGGFCTVGPQNSRNNCHISIPAGAALILAQRKVDTLCDQIEALGVDGVRDVEAAT